jgi:serine protease AprX
VAIRGILLELRVPRGLDSESILSLASDEIRVPTFRLDAAYAPVPLPSGSAPLTGQLSKDESTVLVRGTIEEGDEDALEREPTVVAIWADPRIEAFEERSGSDLVF